MTPDELAALTHRPTTGPFHATVQVDGRSTATLADLPPARNGLLFVAVWPSTESVEAGHYQQAPDERWLWAHLVEATILPAGTAEATGDEGLVAAGHGMTPLVAPGSRDLRAGVGPLWQKVTIWRPAAVVYVDRDAAEAVAGRPLREPWGHLSGVAMSGRPCFLLPGPDADDEQLDESANFLRNLAASLPAEGA